MGRIVTILYANGTSTTYAYDAASRVTGARSALAGGDPINGFVYTRDNVGNPTAVALADGDALAFSYDANGNTTRVAPAET
jgi:YD repeat-containing protein